MITNWQDFATRHRIDTTAEMVASHEAPGTPTGEEQTWRWSAITDRGTIEIEDDTDGSGVHDALSRLFEWWRDERPTNAELEHALDVLGPAAVAELLAP